MEKNKERTERELKTQYPLLARIRPWLKGQLKKADAEHASQHTWDAHIKAIGKIRRTKILTRFKGMDYIATTSISNMNGH